MYIKKGPPIKEVSIPMGTSPPVMVLETLSIVIKKEAPRPQQAGTRTLLLVPTNLLPIWGTTHPTHPMVPLKQTAPAVAKVEKSTINPFSKTIFMPNV